MTTIEGNSWRPVSARYALGRRDCIASGGSSGKFLPRRALCKCLDDFLALKNVKQQAIERLRVDESPREPAPLLGLCLGPWLQKGLPFDDHASEKLIFGRLHSGRLSLCGQFSQLSKSTKPRGGSTHESRSSLCGGS